MTSRTVVFLAVKDEDPISILTGNCPITFSTFFTLALLLLWRFQLSCISVLWLPHRSDHASLHQQQLYCTILSKWTVRLQPIVTIPVVNAHFLVQSASLWTMRTIVAEAVPLDILWRNLSRYLRRTVWDTTHSSLRCRMYRKLSFNSDCPLCSTLSTCIYSSQHIPPSLGVLNGDALIRFSFLFFSFQTLPVMYNGYNFNFFSYSCSTFLDITYFYLWLFTFFYSSLSATCMHAFCCYSSGCVIECRNVPTVNSWLIYMRRVLLRCAGYMHFCFAFCNLFLS